ncbi:MAG TPA: hypothetical protein VLA25_04355 [Methylotenera sp.]|nr:hypothetical protein [Methylotenera sp.]
MESLKQEAVMVSMSIFTRRVISAICAMETATAAADPDYFGDPEREGEMPEFHATPYANALDLLPNAKHPVLKFGIFDQYGSIAGELCICEEAATFAYAIVTG